MLGYVTIGVSDMAKAKAFYTSLLADLGASELLDMGRICFFGKSMGEPMLAICTPYNEQPAAPGNGNMVALSPGSKEAVDRMHEKALSLGATTDGDPGQRIDGQFYGGYVHDADSNKLAFYYFG